LAIVRCGDPEQGTGGPRLLRTGGAPSKNRFAVAMIIRDSDRASGSRTSELTNSAEHCGDS
jgi:hypothetical protein